MHQSCVLCTLDWQIATRFASALCIALEQEMQQVPQVLLEYYASGKSLIAKIPVQPWDCELWSLDQIRAYDNERMLSECAPGYFGFGSNGAGELYTFSPTGEIVCLDVCGLNPKEALPIASSWSEFVAMLQYEL